MGWSGGTFDLSDGTYSSNWAANWRDNGAATILASEFDLLLTDVESGINACLAKDGSNALTGNFDGGGYRITDITASSNTDAGTYGKQPAALAYDSGDDEINMTLNDGTVITCDTSGLSAGTGGVATSGDQTVGGIKTFSAISSLAHAKFNGPTTVKVSNVTSSSTPTIDTTSTDFHYINVNQSMTFDFTWPTGASDTQLGGYWVKRGAILCRWSGASYTIGLNSSMLSSLDDYEIEGTHTTGSGEMSVLTYTYWYLNGTEYAQFAWVATP